MDYQEYEKVKMQKAIYTFIEATLCILCFMVLGFALTLGGQCQR